MGGATVRLTGLREIQTAGGAGVGQGSRHEEGTCQRCFCYGGLLKSM